MSAPDEMDPATLYEAYAAGGISRRAFIARLSAFGVTAAVAAAFANTVGSGMSAAFAGAPGNGGYNDHGDLYNLYNLYDLYDHPGN